MGEWFCSLNIKKNSDEKMKILEKISNGKKIVLDKKKIFFNGKKLYSNGDENTEGNTLYEVRD